jgi:hypothetical protein
MFPMVGKRISFFSDYPFKSMYVVFVNFSFFYTWNKTFPDAAFIPARVTKMCFRVPVIEVSEN